MNGATNRMLADPADSPTDPRWKLTPTKYAVAAILLVGIVIRCWFRPMHRVEPRLLGFPFFYWYQLVWVFLAAGLCAPQLPAAEAGACTLRPRAPASARATARSRPDDRDQLGRP